MAGGDLLVAISGALDYASTDSSTAAMARPSPFLTGSQAVQAASAGSYPPIAIGTWGGITVFACLIDEAAKISLQAAGIRFHAIRQYFRDPPAAGLPFELFARATHLANWFNDTRFCAGCGIRLVDSSTECARRCEVCDRTFYPRINPAIIVAVLRDRQLLLARNVGRPYSFRSILAGFCEAGETLEQTVVREVQEEAGIQIANIRYFQSQSWPFSQSLMVGFLADYAAGDLQPNPTEIADADWFDIDQLPETPPPPSLAWKLIEHAKQELSQ
jgi:NAD+ diphosphatase